MKTSNKLVIGLVSLISLYILAAFTEIKIKGWSKGERTRVDHITELPDFKYLETQHLINPSENISIEIKDQSSYNLSTFEGDDIPVLKYHVQGDTLVIDQVEDLGRSKLVITSNEKILKGIIAKNRSIIQLKGDINSLDIYVKDSRFRWSVLNKESVLKRIKITSSDRSDISIQHRKIENLEVYISQSSLSVNDVENLKGSIKDQTHLAITAISNNSLIQDATCMVSANQSIGHY